MRKAYQEIHKLKVLHGDVRAANILVSDDKSIYIIDFESSRPEEEWRLEDESAEVEKLFKKIKEREYGIR